LTILAGKQQKITPFRTPQCENEHSVTTLYRNRLIESTPTLYFYTKNDPAVPSNSRKQNWA